MPKTEIPVVRYTRGAQVCDTADDIPTNEMIKKTLHWLGKYLGPVKPESLAR
jgi:hypothetical protein